MKQKSAITILGFFLLLLGVVVCAVTIPTVKSFASLLLWRARGRTGTIYNITGDGGMRKSYYENGIREGVWILYDKSGSEVSRSEYRGGVPWNGVCWIYDMKAWTGEYRNGNPWHGCLPVYSPVTKSTDWDYFIAGIKVSYEDYCKEWGLSGPGHTFAGLGYMGVHNENPE